MRKGEADARPGRGKGKSIPIPNPGKQEESNLQPNGKRKYKKRKSKADAEGGEPQTVRDSTEHTESMPPERNAAPAPPRLNLLSPSNRRSRHAPLLLSLMRQP